MRFNTDFERPPAVKRKLLSERFQQVAPTLFRYAVVRLDGDESAADDLMQQLWLEASRDERAAQADDLGAWLRGIVRNLIRRWWREQARPGRQRPAADPTLAAELADVLDQRELPAAELERAEVRTQLLLALTMLPADDQELLIRAHFRGQSHEQIARERNMTTRAVEGRLYRARAAMRELLAHLDPNEAS